VPYIPKEDRRHYENLLTSLANRICANTDSKSRTGHLNYAISRLLALMPANRYRDYNELMGVLECAKLEFYRTKVAPYENKKRRRHGDV